MKKEDISLSEIQQSMKGIPRVIVKSGEIFGQMPGERGALIATVP